MYVTPDSPTARVLDASLIVAPLLYLLTDAVYAAQGWDDRAGAVLHMLAAVVYGIAAVRLVTLAEGRLQAVLLAVAVAGAAGNFGVAVNTLHVSYGHPDLFDLDGAANAWKTAGFFFPLTLLLGAIAVRRLTAAWVPVALVVGAVVFPIAHVRNISALAIVDAVVLLAGLFGVRQSVRSSAPVARHRAAEA